MGISRKFLALTALVCALALVPAALAAGLTIKVTPTNHPKLGSKLQIKVSGFKANEKVKAVELLNQSGQKRTLNTKAGTTGMLVVTLRAQVKGKHTWSFTGRSSHRSGSTYYVVK